MLLQREQPCSNFILKTTILLHGAWVEDPVRTTKTNDCKRTFYIKINKIHTSQVSFFFLDFYTKSFLNSVSCVAFFKASKWIIN